MSHKKIVYSSESESENEQEVVVKPQVVKKERKALSDEQKQVLRDRLTKAREAKQAKRNKVVEPVIEVKKSRKKKVIEEPVELTKKMKNVKIVEPEIEIKKTRVKKTVVVEEPEPEPEVKPKRKYVRKPKITFNPF